MQQHEDPFGTTEVSQDKSLLLNSCHDSVDNNPHSPYPAPRIRLKAFASLLPSDCSSWKCVAAYELLYCWKPCLGLDFHSLQRSFENTAMLLISI